MTQQQKIGTVATTVVRGRVTFHETDVFTLSEDGRSAVLNTMDWKGKKWRTPTTKVRINQALNTFGFKPGVFQENFEWFVTDGNYPNQVVVPFEDGMTVWKNGLEDPSCAESI